MNRLRPVVRNLVRQLNVATAREHSFLNWHAIGFDYLCLARSPGLTVKLYMSRPYSLVTCGNGAYLVNPHDHAYNFDTFVMHGEVTNVLFKETHDDGPRYREHYYDPSSRTATARPDACKLHEYRRDRYAPDGVGYTLPAYAIHTIEVPRTQPVCMLLWQYVSEFFTTRLYLRDGEQPPSKAGLYERPSGNETARLIERAYDFVEERGDRPDERDG